MKAAALLALVLACLPFGALAQTITPAQIAAVEALFADPDRDEKPGCTVEIRRDGQPIISRSFGLANIEWGAPVRRFTVFETGSVAKQFTAAAVAILSLQGKLSLDDDVRKHLPELPDYGAKVTLRQMLNHTSGLREWTEIENAAGRPRDLVSHGNADVLRIMAGEKTLTFPPGSRYAYSNSNYNLMAIVVERASGMSFADFTTKTLFEPLGMPDTQWRDRLGMVVETRADAYVADGAGWWRRDMWNETVVGAGGLLTTVPDLLVWNEALADPKPENAKWVALLHEPGKLSDGKPIEYALGLGVLPLNGTTVVAHSGATAAYRAFLGRIPSTKVSVALLCNGAQFASSELGMKLLQAFIDTKGPTSPTWPR